MRSSFVKVLMCVAIAPMFTGAVHADTLLDESKIISLSTVAPPSEHDFTAAAAEALTVTLTDLQSPAVMGSLQIAVSLGDGLVGVGAVDPATHVATVKIPAAAGDYVLRVVGAPDPTQGFGSFSACVTRDSDPTPRTCIAADSFSDVLVTPSTASATPSSALNTSFVSTSQGTYTVTITDDSFPAALQSLSGGIAQGSTPVGSLFPGSTQIALAAASTYTLVIGALADANAQAGLYGVRVTDPLGVVVFDRTVPVGALQPATSVNSANSQALGLTVTDLAYPAMLSSVGVAVTQGSIDLGQLIAPGTLSTVNVQAGSVQIWQYAVAAAQPGVYSVNLANSALTLYTANQVVDPGSAATNQNYAFIVNLTAGTYNLSVSDFQFPSTFQALTATIAQNGVVLQQSSTGDFTAAQGVAVVLVNAQPPQSGNGIFGVTVQTSGSSPQVLLDQTQAVGGVFDTRTVTVATAGNYDATLTDLGFPVTFQNLAAVVSQGGKVLGKIYGGGVFQFSGTPGSYVLSFVATPSTGGYGLYSLQIASSAPTVTFASSAASVTAGGSVTLTWSSQNATACTASGSSAWTGSEATSGTLSVPVAAASTFTLACTGPGGSATQSVSVSTTAPATSGGGGGGGIDAASLAGLVGLLAYARRRRAARGDVAVL